MNDASTERIHVGPHVLTLIPPDLLQLELNTSLEPDDVTRILDVMTRSAVERGPCKVLAVFSRVPGVPRHVRETVRARKTVTPIAAVAIVGAPFALRVAIDMLLNALRLLKSEFRHYPHAFFDRKEDALAWLRSLPSTAPSNDAAPDIKAEAR